MKKLHLEIFKLNEVLKNQIKGGKRIFVTQNTGGGAGTSYTNSTGGSCKDECVSGSTDIEWYDECEIENNNPDIVFSTGGEISYTSVG